MTTISIHLRGPLALYAHGFDDRLSSTGYMEGPRRRQLNLVAQLSSWMEAVGIGPNDLVGDRLVDFTEHRRSSGETTLLSVAALSPVLGYLRHVGALQASVSSLAQGSHDQLLAAYERHLIEVRALASSSVAVYLRIARGALARLATNAEDLRTLSPAHAAAYVQSEVTTRRVASAQQMVNALRSLMRFLYVTGATCVDLSVVIPGVPGWSAPNVSRAVDSIRVEKLLASLDVSSGAGRRDAAMVLLAWRLALRSFEVTSLRLDDIDWRHGEIIVRGKGHVIERLPLPSDVGAALARYLSHDRPKSVERWVFLTERAPTRRLGRGGVGAVIKRACARAGLEHFGAHALRHAAATNVLRAGAPLAEVSELLRHRSAGSSARYASVDAVAMAPLAREWPAVNA